MVVTTYALGQTQNIDLPNLTTSVMPSVVTIYASNESGGNASLGSGFFVSSTDIITCYHVIANRSRINISTYTSLGEYRAQLSRNENEQLSVLPSQLCIPVSGINATLAENDPDHDLARLSIKSPVGRPLRINCKYPLQGEAVFLFGSPDSDVFTITSGIVSGYRFVYQTMENLSLSPEDLEKIGFDILMNLPKQYSKAVKKGFVIQYQAPTSAGNSGGPLVNATGDVIGICDSESTEKFSQNINYAIPSVYLSKVMDKTSIRACSDSSQSFLS